MFDFYIVFDRIHCPFSSVTIWTASHCFDIVLRTIYVFQTDKDWPGALVEYRINMQPINANNINNNKQPPASSCLDFLWEAR